VLRVNVRVMMFNALTLTPTLNTISIIKSGSKIKVLFTETCGCKIKVLFAKN
jgi:hypothetical protein